MTQDQDEKPDAELTPFERGARIARQRGAGHDFRVDNRARPAGELAPRSPRDEREGEGQ
ncbi:hypothetical protein [Nocardioides sp.]|uniref:hypothetical protein n=1 Tax=Nocardioides sp. TaxID=35761 RepID=UPI00261EE737|nr:hypothetical protein [Nocardioides sp.]MCW2735454.1 hypothetical protein [Nocardioides sp.]